jgi:hypothetical protein
MRTQLIIVLLLVLITLQVFVLGRATEENKKLPMSQDDGYVISSPILKIAALEFDGLASDFMFLKALVFVGSTFERQKMPNNTGIPLINQETQWIKEWEWRWLYNVLDSSAGLDPYFLDPYYFANANLTWGGGLIQETNLLLEKGNRYRNWDWLLPFYIGFNNFYFLHNNDIASEYLMEASRRPNGSPSLASLAARLAYKDKRTEYSILFLEEILKNTTDEVIKNRYKTRLQSLNDILYLEKAVIAFKQKFRHNPDHLDALIQKHIIEKFPVDPYRGKYYIDSQGKVRTTSESMLVPYQH